MVMEEQLFKPVKQFKPFKLFTPSVILPGATGA
jgi:hypothetical protein